MRIEDSVIAGAAAARLVVYVVYDTREM